MREILCIGVTRSLTWEALTQFSNGRGLLLFTNLLILLFIGRSPKALPRKTTPQEVHEHVSKRFKVITAGLLTAKMRVDRHVPGSAR